MTRNGYISLAGLTVSAFAATFIYAAVQIALIERSLSQAINEPMLWIVSQAERQAAMMRLSLARVEEGEDFSDVTLQFNLIFNQLNLMSDEPQRGYFREIGAGPLVEEVTELMRKLDERPLSELLTADGDARIEELQSLLRQLSIKAFLGERLWRQGYRNKERAAFTVLIVTFCGAFFAGGVMALLLMRSIKTANTARAALERHSSMLEEQVADRTRELREALDVEKLAKEVYRSFVYTVSHQFRTPVSIIHLVAQRQIRGIDQGGAEPEARRPYVKIVAAAERLDSLLNKFLSAASVERGLIETNLEKIDFNDVVREAIGEIEKAYPEREIISSISPAPLPVLGDPGLLDQAILVLLENAIKYSAAPEGIHVATRESSGRVFCTVRDKGIGIPEDSRSAIFERFYRAQNARQHPGAGVGLSLARGIADLHNGSISVLSEVGHGSEFTLGLPRRGT